MPGGDGTGPQGQGPMTGRGAGYCAGSPVPGYANSAPGRGWGRGRGGFGRGGGRGRRNWYYATGLPGWQRAAMGYPAFGEGVNPYAPQISAQEERDMLKDQAEFLKQQLDDVQSRISALEKDQAQDKK